MTSFSQLQRLDRRTAIVTGGAGILGSRFCAGFAELGANVVIADLDGEAARDLAARLAAEHAARVDAVQCDITDRDAVDGLVSATVERHGGVDILANNAATKGSDLRRFFSPFEEYPLETWREVMAVNVDAMFLVAQRVGRQMIAQGRGGSVIQTSSIYGLVGADGRIYEGSDYLGGPINTPAVYAVSKAAVIGLTRHLATYWAEHGIRVNCIAPGGVASGQNEAFDQRYSARVPLGRMADADEIVGTVLFLASDAASYITGQTIAVDGGLTAW